MSDFQENNWKDKLEDFKQEAIHKAEVLKDGAQTKIGEAKEYIGRHRKED